MTYQQLSTIQDFEQLVESKPALAVYFRGAGCGVCGALLPKLEDMLKKHFPAIELQVVDVEKTPELAAYLSVLSVPGLLVYFDSRLFIKEVRHINLASVQTELSRPYSLMFG